MKVNYGFQRMERDRAKQAKKEAKAREKAAAATSAEAAQTTPEPNLDERGSPPGHERVA